MIRIVGAIVAGLVLALAGSAHALTLQPIGSFEQPIYVTSDPGNPERLFVVEREGQIEQVQDGSVTAPSPTSRRGRLLGGCDGRARAALDRAGA